MSIILHTSRYWRRSLDLRREWARIEEPITDRLLHGASAIEEDEFSELDLAYLLPNEPVCAPWESSPAFRAKYPIYKNDLWDHITRSA